MALTSPEGKYYRKHIYDGAAHENDEVEGCNPSEFVPYMSINNAHCLGIELKDGSVELIWAGPPKAAPSEDLKELGKALKAKAKAKAKAAPKKTVKKKK
jgi:hypothetical protein